MNKALHILFAEDDPTLSYLVKESLEKAGHLLTLAPNGEVAFDIFINSAFDLCLLDIMMPVKDGLSLSKQIRKKNSKIPIIFLTAKQHEKDKIEAFKNGADDYIVKPFSMTELLLRINAIMRRINSVTENSSEQNPTNKFKFGKFEFDYAQRLLIGFHETKILSAREADLLKLFCENKNTLLYRSHILKEIWKDDDYFMAKTMDVFITRLRKLLKSDTSIEIRNLYGTGFKLVIKD